MKNRSVQTLNVSLSASDWELYVDVIGAEYAAHALSSAATDALHAAWDSFAIKNEISFTAACEFALRKWQKAARQFARWGANDSEPRNKMRDLAETLLTQVSEAADAQTHYAEFLQEWANDCIAAKEDAEQMQAEAGEGAGVDGSRHTAQPAQEVPPIDAATFRRVRAQIAGMAGEASRRCGLSYEYMVCLLCPMVEGLLSEFPLEQRPGVAMVARMFGYVSPEELAQAQQEMADKGYCRHGLDYWTCPCGCFEN